MNSKLLLTLVVFFAPQLSVAGEKICESGLLPPAYHGSYVDSSTAQGTAVELTATAYKFPDFGGGLQLASCIVQGFRILTITDQSSPDSVENGVLLQAESGSLVLIKLRRTPTSNWPNRVVDLIRMATPGLVLQKVN